MQKVREWLVLSLIIGLPFHAFLLTVGTRLLVGPGHVPLPWLAGWKEGVLGLVLLCAIAEFIMRRVSKYQFSISSEFPNTNFQTDVLDWLILGLLSLSVLVPTTYHLPIRPELTAEWPPTTYLYGFKYTLFPLLLFLILRRVPWSQRSFQLSAFSFQLVGALVAAYGILTLFLPESFFTWLGYSDLHSLYLPDGPIAAFQKIEGTGIRRIQSTFSGPNQLGMWLLIPWSVAVVKSARGQLLGYWVTGLLGIALLFTFSRAAWIGAAVIVGVLLTTHYKLLTRWKFLGSLPYRQAGLVIGFLGVAVIGAVLFPDLLLRTASSREHWRRPMEAIRIIAAHPLGLGLGSAGPASNRTSDPCVFLEGGADTSWANDRPNLCVFSGNVQVQPADRACQCPFLPENWYLQVGVELGVIGLVLYLVLIGVISYWLLVIGHSSVSCLVFLGVSTAALFLHAWEDSAVAYTVWILLATVLPVPASRPAR